VNVVKFPTSERHERLERLLPSIKLDLFTSTEMNL